MTVGTNVCSVPWRLIGERVRVVVSGARVRVYHNRDVVPEHDEHHGRSGRITDRTHLEGINTGPLQVEDEDADEPSLLRPLADFDFTAQPSVDKRQIQDLTAARWVAHGDAVLLLGPPGVGKSASGLALGREAIRHGYSVRSRRRRR